MNIRDIQSEIENIFDNFNRDLFDGELPQPIITIQSAGKKKFLGWCTSKKVWKSNDGSEERYEINVVAEYLSRPIEEIGETLLHEAQHLYSLSHGIKDFSGLYYHNKKFRDCCKTHGLNCIQGDNFQIQGWCRTSFNDEGWEAFKRINIDLKAFDFARIPIGETKERKKRTTTSKLVYKCACGNVIRSKKELNVRCLDCGENFEIQDPEEDGEEDN